MKFYIKGLFLLTFTQIYVNCLLEVLNPTEEYTHHLVVDELNPEQYQVFWKVLDNDEIQFEVHCKTTGWVGLGLSPNGGMTNSDIAIGWVDDKTNKAHLKDCFATTKGTPKIDDHQDWFLIEGAEINGYTILKYKRKLHTCDTQDRAVEVGTVYLIFAWNNNDPITGNNDWEFHGENRLQKTELLLNYKPDSLEEQSSLPSDTYTYDMMMPNVEIPKKDTYYYCRVFEIPEVDTRTHIVQFEMVVDPNNRKIVHHVLGYECNSDYEPNGVHEEECGLEATYMTKSCVQQLIIGWSIGGHYNYSFPKEAGYPLNPNQSNKKRYFMLEMHYDNPRLESGRTDNSGVRIYLTKTLRQHDLGSIVLGIDGTPLQLQMPPHTDSIKFKSVCYPECTDAFIPPEGINVVSALLHTHLAGRSIETKLVRGGKVIGKLFDNPSYDFNYQFVMDIKPTKLFKGDALVTTCGYSTMDRSKFTYFGIGTREEMCFDFVYYYPKVPNFYNCFSRTPHSVMFDFYRSLIKESLIPNKEFNQTTSYVDIYDYFNNKVNVTTKLIERFKQFEESHHNRTLYCGTFAGENVMYKENIADYKPIDDYVEPDACEASHSFVCKANINFIILIAALSIFYGYLKVD